MKQYMIGFSVIWALVATPEHPMVNGLSNFVILAGIELSVAPEHPRTSALEHPRHPSPAGCLEARKTAMSSLGYWGAQVFVHFHDEEPYLCYQGVAHICPNWVLG